MTVWQTVKKLLGRPASALPVIADLSAPENGVPAETPVGPSVLVTGHIGNIGDCQPNANGWVGRASGLGVLEGFRVVSDRPAWQDDVTVQAVLHDGTLGPAIPGGLYCGTTGKGLPLHGFVLQVAEHAADLAGLTCEGVFQDGFRSARLPPGKICASPGNAALLAMRIASGPVANSGPDGAMPAGFHWLPPAPMTGPALAPDNVEKSADAPADSVDEPVGTTLVGHIANIGDTAADRDNWVGVTEKRGNIEGFTFSSLRPGWNRDVSYRSVLPTGELGPLVEGGSYCGTRGKGLPIHGFVVHVREAGYALEGLCYEGVFAGGFRSGLLHAGDICVAPDRVPLVALRIGLSPEAPARPDAAEPVRAVIWDLDDTFWGGTLTEGGIVWREENAGIVRELARRGIVSSICSKNDPAPVLSVLEAHGLRDYFVFPSISWDPKGPRLKNLVETLQLRAPTLLFIDDNPMNRAEAETFVPGLQVHDENIVPKLLADAKLQGRADPEMKRLAQYRVLERRQADQVQSGADTADFLRASGVTVIIEHDLAPHIDRAVELINRTNQLNFTKQRLLEDPANPEVARRDLRALLAEYDVQAGILRVRDRYGDYGYCGLYVSRRYSVGPTELLHFAFSCRILGMGVETWLYRRLQRPKLNVSGAVLANVFDETRVIDWISADLPGIASVPAAARHELTPAVERHELKYVLARGACDMRALSHYFNMVADRVIEEFDTVRVGQTPLVNHSLIATQAMDGIDPAAVADFTPLGFLPEDFNTVLAGDLPAGPAVWVLGFTIEQAVPIYRHTATGALLPASVVNLRSRPDSMMGGAPVDGADPQVIAHLREKFTYFGQRPDDRLDRLMQDALRRIFGRAGSDVRIFVLLANTFRLNGEGCETVSELFRHHNGVVVQVAAEFANVETLSPESFMTRAELRALKAPHHFDRIVYFRLFRHMMDQIRRVKAHL